MSRCHRRIQVCLGAAHWARRPGSLDRYLQRNKQRNSDPNGSTHARTGENVLRLSEAADPEESVNQSILAVGLEGNAEVDCLAGMHMIFDLCFMITSSKHGSRAVARYWSDLANDVSHRSREYRHPRVE